MRRICALIVLAVLVVPEAAAAILGKGNFIAESAQLIGTDVWQDQLGITGLGVQVLVVDSSFAQLSDATAAGELPAVADACNMTPDPLEDPEGRNPDHGTLVSQVLLDNAPRIDLFVAKVDSASDFALWKLCSGHPLGLTFGQFLTNNGIDIVVLSLSWFGNAHFDGTHPVDQFIDAERARGRLWFKSAGNYAESHWGGTLGAGQLTTTLEVDANPGLPPSAPRKFRLYENWDQWGNPVTSSC